MYRVSLPNDAEVYKYNDIDPAMKKATGLIKIHKEVLLLRTEEMLPLAGFIFVVDPGHGGADSGAHDGQETAYGDYINSYEKYINLDISLLLASELRKLGATVYLTRDKDVTVDLGARAPIANKVKADYFISVHFNSHQNVSAEGVEVFTHTNKVNADVLAKNVLAGIIAESGAKNRGVKKANFKVLRDCNSPSILIEYGFISNVKEEKLCSDNNYRARLVRGTINGIIKTVIR